MPTQHIWVVVSNSTHARFFEADGNQQLREMEDMSHPKGRMRNQDLTTDSPGGQFSNAPLARHGEGPRIEAKTMEFEHFAETLTNFLTEAHRAGKFKKLYLAANPSFLGILRQHINTELAPTIAAEFNVDLTHMPPGDIRKHLPYIL